MRKILSLVMVLSLVLGSFSFAFAANATLTSDVTDKDVKEAVERLAAFGIVNGMDDGKYHPDTKVTREQFAKLVVEALGLGSAADAAKGATQFTDVEASRWSSGYINVAVGQGIIKGMGDGTFAPGSEVTYAQAVTMLVRSLGYKDEFLSGSWPGNYVSKAAALDITDDVTFSPSGTADRGSVAVMVNNTLDAKVIEQYSYGDENNWTETDTTLLEEKLNLTLIEEEVIEAVAKVDDTLKANEITVDGDDYEVIYDVDTTNLFGLEADVYLNDDDEVVYIDVTTADKDIVVGTITDLEEDDTDISVMNASGEEDDYDLASDLDLYINNEKVADDADIKDLGLYGTFVLDEDGDVAFADLYDFDDAGIIVQEVNADKEYVKGLLGTQDNIKVEFDSQDGYKIFKDSEVIDIDDIEEGDIVYSVEVNEYDGDTYVYGFVVNNTIEGELEKVKDDEITVSGEDYDVDEVLTTVTYSLDNDDDDPEEFNDAELLEDAVKENSTVKVYLDIKGEVRHIVTDVEATSDTLYGIVTKDGFLEDGTDAVKIYTKDDDDITYIFDEEESGLTDEVEKGDLVAYELTSDGTIDEEEYDVLDMDKVIVQEFDDDKDYIKAGGVKYYVEDDTVIMSYYDKDEYKKGNEIVDPEVVSWEDIEDSTVEATDGLTMVVVTDDDDDITAKFIVFIDNYDITGDGHSAYVLADPYYDGDWKVDVELFDGTEKTYELEDKDLVEEGDFIVFSTNQDGEIDSQDTVIAVKDADYATTNDVNDVDVEYEMAAGEVVTFENDVIKLASGSYKLTDDTAVYVLTLDDDNEYDEVDNGDFTDIYEDEIVRVIVNDGDVEIVVVLDGDELDSIEDAVTVDTVEVDEDEFTVAVGGDVELPETATVTYSDGEEEEVDVDWEDFSTDEAGTITVEGTVEVDGDEYTVNVTVVVEEEVTGDVTGTVEKATNNPMFGMTTITVTLEGTDTPEDCTVTIDGTEIPYKDADGVHKLTVASSDALAQMTEAELQEALVIE